MCDNTSWIRQIVPKHTIENVLCQNKWDAATNNGFIIHRFEQYTCMMVAASGLANTNHAHLCTGFDTTTTDQIEANCCSIDPFISRSHCVFGNRLEITWGIYFCSSRVSKGTGTQNASPKITFWKPYYLKNKIEIDFIALGLRTDSLYNQPWVALAAVVHSTVLIN